MIQGQVNARKEAVVPLQIRDINGRNVDVQVVIDTGFSGFLTLPLSLVLSLKLPLIGTRRYSLGDNSKVGFDVYAATIVWDGNDKHILVLAASSGALLGMSLLHSYQLFVDVIDGGDVTIEERP